MGLDEPGIEQGLDLNYVPGAPQPIEPQNGNGRVVALSNSFAFGGHNATVALTA